ncbi:MAG: hypothetical protein ACTSW4_07430 [Candidatus Ranarchaeia archaeon]
MISEVVVMNIAGQPLFRKAYDPQASQVDPSLSSGLITAVYHFTNQVRGEAIKMMELAGAKVCFDESDGILFVITVEGRLPDQDALDIVLAIRNAWFEKYKDKHLTLIDTKEFEDFEPIVDKIVYQNLWWLKGGQKFSLKNQLKYLREISVRPSRAIGTEYLNNTYFLLPALFFAITIGITHLLGSQLANIQFSYVWVSSLKFLIANLVNIGALWIMLPLLGCILNGRLDKFRSTFLSVGYLMVFWIPIMFFTSRVYLLLALGQPSGVPPYDLFNPDPTGYIVYENYIINEVPLLEYWLLWSGPVNGLFFYWVFLYAYVAYNIQRPTVGRFILSTILSLMIVWVFQTIMYMLILEQLPLSTVPSELLI